MLGKTELVKRIEVNYKVAGEGGPLLILHGWGSGSDSWVKVAELIAEKGYRVIVPDLPGFGKTPAPPAVWGVEEYAEFVNEFAEKLGLQKFVLAGHSFGGQVAVKFAAVHPEKLERLILCAPAAIRKEPGLTDTLVICAAKAGSVILFLIPSAGLQEFTRKVFARMIGRSDYLQAPGIMRKVMQRVIREDLSGLFALINTKTLLVWGEKDRPVPVEDAYVMEKRLSHSSLKVIPGASHRVHREAPEILSKIICSWLSY